MKKERGRESMEKFSFVKFRSTCLWLILACFLCFLPPAVSAGSLSSITGKGAVEADSLDIREGDMVFQHLSGRLTRVIADVTHSPYSHCGLVVVKDGSLYVLEAIGPVRETLLKDWVLRGVGHRITVTRLKPAERSKIPAIIQAAYRYLGAPYDIQYEWDDRKIYCSELLYKAAYEGAGLKLADLKRLGDLDWRPHEAFIRYITGGELPLDREMITPHDLVGSALTDIVYSDLPPGAGAVVFAPGDLEGAWRGDYTFPGGKLIQAVIAFNAQGQVREGNLAESISIRSGAVRSFNRKTGAFRVLLVDSNRTRVRISARMDPGKDGIYGEWRDSRGYTGVFSLSRTSGAEEGNAK